MKKKVVDGKIQEIMLIDFCLHAIKSSETDKSQANSIESQINKLATLVDVEKLFIKEVKQESHSAKSSGQDWCR